MGQAGRVGGSAPNSIGKNYTLSNRQVPGAMNSNFSTGRGLTSRQNPMRSNPSMAKNTSAGTRAE